MIRRALLLAAASLAIATPAAAEDFVIVNATLVTGDGSEPISDGVLIVDDNRVAYAGPRAGAGAFSTETVYDVGGAWVTPGLVATVTTLGLSDVSAVSESNDIRPGSSLWGAALDVAPAINPSSQHILVHRGAGPALGHHHGLDGEGRVLLPAQALVGRIAGHGRQDHQEPNERAVFEGPFRQVERHGCGLGR